ncbi:biotin-dependent carboxyltransferase family protein [Pseudoalteromonas obscura]|uniref:Biotin-dependent carboxyltransferase family protein n=1 Tax=Pseudoalteromonas obscura TaxID=3048491 RepID=A0ABT7EFV4_9GAMM|nr:biotin-dependent carboxyltransferase family protein [Pseudoalteromonas sp. P94(2023)]MDK2593494.1 biotin-dependent carboxyltransferase family protein [Pseudoalteromonas sp. P94(2023)]
MLTILKSGIQTCIQDLGRYGFRHLGVSQAGVMDPLAAKSANILLNNSTDSAVIEITVGLCKFKFDHPTNFSLTGADLGAKLNGKSIATGWRYHAEANDILTFASSKSGTRAYFAVQGGFNDVTPVMHSSATDIQAGFGGLSGRALQDGDVLPYTPFNALDSIGAALPDYVDTIRVIPGPHVDLLPKDNQQSLYNQQWQVQPNSNRMGLRVASDIDISHNVSITSQAVSPGVIQLPPNGQPIVLLNDCQTTGGYPIIAHVIEADLRHLGQLHAGARCQFRAVNRLQAQQALDQQQQHLAQLKIAVLHHDKKNI